MLMTVYMLTKNVQILNWCSNTDEQPLALLQGKKKLMTKKLQTKKQTETWVVTEQAYDFMIIKSKQVN